MNGEWSGDLRSSKEDGPGAGKRLVASGASIVLAGKVAGRGLHLLTQVVLARVLGPAQYGLYAIGWTILRIGGVVAPLGLHNGVISFGTPRWATDRPTLKRLVTAALGISFLFGGFLSLWLWFMADTIAAVFFHKPQLAALLKGFALGLPFSSVLIVAAACTRTRKKMLPSVISEEVGQPLVQLGFVSLALGLGWGLKGAVGATVSSFVVASILALFFVRLLVGTSGIVPAARERLVGGMLGFAVPTALAGTLSIVNHWADRLLLGGLRPSAEVGIYQAASQLSIIFAIILSGFSTAFSPLIADYFERTEYSSLRSIFATSTRWGLYISTPLFLLMVTHPQDILTALFGDRYGSAHTALSILCVGQFINMATGAVGTVIILTRRQMAWIWISATGLFLNISLNLLWIPSRGAVGAALATALSTAVLYISATLYVRFKMNLSPYDRRYWKGIVAAGIVLMMFVAERLIFENSTLISILTLLAIGYGVFWGGIVLMGLDSEDRQVFEALVLRRRRWQARSEQ